MILLNFIDKIFIYISKDRRGVNRDWTKATKLVNRFTILWLTSRFVLDNGVNKLPLNFFLVHFDSIRKTP